MSDEVTARVSSFIAETALSDVPEAAVTNAKHSILDGFGLAVAGAASEAARIARDEILEYRCGATDASVLGSSVRLPARFAAFLNGLAIHADDYDDTQLATLPDRVYGLLTHPTAPVLPAVLALAESLHKSGEEALEAYLVGTEAECKIAEAINPRHYDAGFHSTATAGTIGAGAAAARLLGLSAEETAVALGIAASCAGGLRENFGTMTKPFHAGKAAENGVLAASLAADGFTATHSVLEARRGYFSAAGGGFDEATMADLGKTWTFDKPGVSIKPHPSGSLTHPAMTTMLGLIHEHGLTADDVEQVRVGTNRHMPNALIHHRPQDHLAAKFSMEFCMAILLIEGRGGLREFADAVVTRPDVQAMIERVRFEVDEEAEKAGYNTMTSIVTVTLKDGRTVEGRAAFAKGSPANPMSDSELREKFLDCLDAGGISADSGNRAADLILEIEKQPNVDAIMELLAPGRRGM